jgi:dCMP deaminase
VIWLLEGVDGAGKTTLARELSQRLNVPIYKSANKPISHSDDQHTAQVIAVLEDHARTSLLAAVDDVDLILDRGFPSNWVYGNYFEREFSREEVWAQDAVLAEVPHRAILLTRAGYPRNSDSHLAQEDVNGIESLYREYANRSKLDWTVLRPETSVYRRVEIVMGKVVEDRPQLDEVHLAMAKLVAKRSTCLSRRNGAVLVSHDGYVIATGYNGSPRGMEHQKRCPRLEQGAPSGSRLELCHDVHAEENCIVQAAKLGTSVVGSTLYTVMSPCHRCFRMLANAEVREVVYEREYGDVSAMSMGVPGIKIRRK